MPDDEVCFERQYECPFKVRPKMIRSIEYDSSRRSSGSDGSSVSSSASVHANVFNFLSGRNSYSSSSLSASTRLSDIFHPKSPTLLTEEHVWALINQITACLECILRDYEFQANDEKLFLSEFKSFDDILFCDDGTLDPRSFVSNNCDDNIHITGPGSVNKIIHSIGLLFYDVFSTTVLKSSKSVPMLLETDLDDEQIPTKRHTFDDDDYEADLDPELEDLFMTMLESSSETPASDKDEGYGRESPVQCVCNSTALILVRQKCSLHFSEQVKRYRQSADQCCPILRSLLANSDTIPANSDDYYRAVCCETLDEFRKLNKLLTQLDESRKFVSDKNKTTVLPVDHNDNHHTAEDIKVWAQTWIKVMTQLRIGSQLKPASERCQKTGNEVTDNGSAVTRLEPFNKLMADIRQLDHSKLRNVKQDKFDTKRFTPAELKRASSVPALSDYRLSLTRSAIQKRLQELKPASSRRLADPPPTEKCLHECLMDSIRASNSSQLRRTETIVKPDIYSLYLEEKSSELLKRSKSMRQLSGSYYSESKTKKRKSFFRNSVLSEETFDLDLLNSAANSTLNLTSTPKNSQFDHPGILRRAKSMNFSSKQRKEQQLLNNKLNKDADSLYGTLNDSETTIQQRTYELENQTKISENFSWRRSFIRKSKPKDFWRYSINSQNDPYDIMKRNTTFSRSKSTSRFSVSNFLHKWFIGDSSYQDDRKYKND